MATKAKAKVKVSAKPKKITRAEKSAANKAAYAAEKKILATAGRRGNPLGVKRDPDRLMKLIPEHERTGITEARRRGAQTDEDAIDEICELVAAGMSLCQARDEVGVCANHWGQWRKDNHHNINEKIEYARREKVEAWADDIIELADEATHDDNLGKKLQIETRKWLMGKWNKGYADKNTTVLEGGDTPLRHITSDMSLEEAAAEYAKTVASTRKTITGE